MGKYLVVGASKGLGLELTCKLIARGDTVIAISRDNIKSISSTLLETKKLDLENATSSDIAELMDEIGNLSGVCFCQRYRGILENILKEYKLNLHSISMFMEKIRKDYHSGKRFDFMRIVLIGSTYTLFSGNDQSLSYHASKNAQSGLVKFYAMRSDGFYNINMLSPPTFIKKGAEEYWKAHQKTKKWRNFPTQRLPDVGEIADLAGMLLMSSNMFLNGQNIVCDGGASLIYQDQL